MDSVYICHTPYHLFISIIKIILSKQMKKNDLIICNSDSFNKETLSNVKKIFKKVFIYSHENLDANIPSISWIDRIKNGLLFYNSLMETKTGLFKEYFNTRNVFIFNDNSFFGFWFNISKIKYNLLEDGLNCFQTPFFKRFLPKHKYPLIDKLLGLYWNCYGFSKYTQQIEVNDSLHLLIKHKNIVECNRNKLYHKLDQKDIKLIADIFGYESVNKISTNSFFTKSTLLLTQPLSEDGLISHEKKIALYQYLVNKYAIGLLYIKPHPRDKENWTEIFPNAQILGIPKIPFELYLLNEKMHFNRAITAFSTSIDNIFCADDKIKKSYSFVVNF